MKKKYSALAVMIDCRDITAGKVIIASMWALGVMLYDIGGYDGKTVFNSCLDNSCITKGSAYRR